VREHRLRWCWVWVSYTLRGMAAMKTKFEQLRVGEKFMYRGELYSKLAVSLAQDEKRIGMIFHADVKVERLTVGDGSLEMGDGLGEL
jgi:hypothetical protein